MIPDYPIPKFILSVCFLLIQLSLAAQANSRFSLTLSDSLSTDENSSFIYNVIKVRNTSNSKLNLSLSLNAPPGWRVLSSADNTQPLELQPDETQIIPLTLMKLPDAVARWLPVIINVKEKNTADSNSYTFYVKPNAVNSFRIIPITNFILFAENQKTYTILFKIKNTGSTDGLYKVYFKNKHLFMNTESTTMLSPGHDTTYVHTFTISNKLYENLRQEKINVEVTDTTGTEYGYQVDLIKLQTSYKEHLSPYETFPVEFETGMLNFNNRVYYFGSVNGNIKINKNHLSFFYHTKEYGNSNRLEKNIFRINFISTNWEISVGQMSESKYFFNMGNGAKLTYRKNKTEVSLYGIRHNNYYSLKNDNIAATIKYSIHTITLLHAISANLDAGTLYNSYLLSNELQLVNKKNIAFGINAGAGIDHSRVPLSAGQKYKPGTALGYSFLFKKGSWTFISNIQNNNHYYPGINKGMKIQSHTIKKQIKNKSIELFYQYNQLPSTILRDTLYNTDLLNYNMSRYGLQLGWTNINHSLSLSIGKLKQSIQFSSLLPKYNFAEIYYSFNTGTNFSFLINSLNGFTNSYGADKQSILVSNSNFSVVFKKWGIRGFYFQNPIFDNTNTKNFIRYDKTLLIGPNIKFVLFRKIYTNLSYNISKSIFDNSVKSYAGFSLRYNSIKNGLSFSLNGSLPLYQSQVSSTSSLNNANRLSNQYVTLSVHKKFNVPVISSKKYPTLLIIPFNDADHNGKRNNSEETLKKVKINVNKIPFQSNDKGIISYKNIDTGKYSISFNQVNELKGLVPVSETTQILSINKDTVVEIPFRKSKVITGKIKMELDPLNHADFTPENLKVTVTDSLGNVFSALTNEKGEFFINLVSNVYIVSLNPDSFSDKIKPVQMAYKVDLTQKDEENVVFEIRDNKRQVRFLKKID